MREYVVDKEIAKELKENGFPQNTNYFHAKWSTACVKSGQWDLFTAPLDNKCIQTNTDYSAPISYEILKELKKFRVMIISNFNDSGKYQISCDKGNLQEPNSISLRIYDKKTSNALAKLWINLKKEGHIK